MLQPARLRADHLARAAHVLGRQDVVGEGLGVAGDGGQRCPQLVGDRQQEAALPVLGVRQLGGEGVERGGDVGDLLRAARPDPHVPLPRREPAGGGGDPAQRAGDALGQQQGADGAEQQDDRAGDDRPVPLGRRQPPGLRERPRQQDDASVVRGARHHEPFPARRGPGHRIGPLDRGRDVRGGERNGRHRAGPGHGHDDALSREAGAQRGRRDGPAGADPRGEVVRLKGEGGRGLIEIGLALRAGQGDAGDQAPGERDQRDQAQHPDRQRPERPHGEALVPREPCGSTA